MKRISLGILLLSILLNGWGKGGDSSFKSKSVQPDKTEEKIRIDGKLDEGVWEDAFVLKDFWLHSPVDDQYDPIKTEVKISFDNDKLYVAAICFDDNKENVIQGLKRDGESQYWRSDGIGFVLDPGHQKKNGFFFAVNAAEQSSMLRWQ